MSAHWVRLAFDRGELAGYRTLPTRQRRISYGPLRDVALARGVTALDFDMVGVPTAPYHGLRKAGHFRGVCHERHRWRAHLWHPIARKVIHLGSYKTQEEAARAHDAGVRKYRPDLPLNFPEDSVVSA